MKDQLNSDKNIIKIKQLEAYSRGLEEQFNAQMDIIEALKKKLVILKKLKKNQSLFIYFFRLKEILNQQIVLAGHQTVAKEQTH